MTDDEFKASVQAILAEFEGKNLLHQNIGQLTWMKEKGNPSKKHKFERIWVLLDQVNPRIGEAFNCWLEKRPK